MSVSKNPLSWASRRCLVGVFGVSGSPSGDERNGQGGLCWGRAES